MPLDDTIGLLDPKVKPEVFSVEGLRDWPQTMPPNDYYDFLDPQGKCLFGLFYVEHAWTFGAALARCEAYLSTTSGDGRD
jgi:hypothetical protein